MHLFWHALRLGSLVVDFFVTHRPGDHLHFSGAVLGHFYGVEAAAPRGEQYVMPAEEAVVGKGLGGMAAPRALH